METPEAPPEESAAGLGDSVQGYGRAAGRWAGRGDEARGHSLLALVAAAGSFVCLFLPWLGEAGQTVSGWNLQLGRDLGLVALAVVLVELLVLARAWASHGAALVSFCLIAGAGVLGVSAVADLRWGGLISSGFSAFQYGAWLALVFAILLVALAVLRLAALWRPAP